jgi:hypothetical protein
VGWSRTCDPNVADVRPRSSNARRRPSHEPRQQTTLLVERRTSRRMCRVRSHAALTVESEGDSSVRLAYLMPALASANDGSRDAPAMPGDRRLAIPRSRPRREHQLPRAPTLNVQAAGLSRSSNAVTRVLRTGWRARRYALSPRSTASCGQAAQLACVRRRGSNRELRTRQVRLLRRRRVPLLDRPPRHKMRLSPVAWDQIHKSSSLPSTDSGCRSSRRADGYTALSQFLARVKLRGVGFWWPGRGEARRACSVALRGECRPCRAAFESRSVLSWKDCC